MLDALGLAFDVLVQALALLPEMGQAAAAGRHAALEAFVVLGDDDTFGTEYQGALDHLHVALKHLGLLLVINRHLVGFDMRWLVAVGFFGMCGKAGDQARQAGGNRQQGDQRRGQ